MINTIKISALTALLFFFGCNNYNENERNLMINYSLLSSSKYALSETNDTIYVYDEIMKSLAEMEKSTSNYKKNNTILLKVLLKVKDYDQIIEDYTIKDLSKNKSFTQEVIMGIAMDKKNNTTESSKHFDNALQIVKENYLSEIHPFYEDYIEYLKTKDYESYRLKLISPNNNHPIYQKAQLDNLFYSSNKEDNYNDFISSANDLYNFPFFPVEE